MLIWPTAHHVGESEHAVAEALRSAPAGIALVGVRVPGRSGREIDVLVVTPDGVSTIEAKGTGLSGQVTTSDNGDWLVGGQVADFAGSTNPISQAQAQAQRLRDLCRRNDLEVGYIQAYIVVVGAVTCAPTRLSGSVFASDVERLVESLDQARHRPLPRADVRRLLALLDLGNRTPGDDALDAAGFPRDDGSMPPAGAAPVAPPVAPAYPPPAPHRPAAAHPQPAAYASPPPHFPPPPQGRWYSAPPSRRSSRRPPRYTKDRFQYGPGPYSWQPPPPRRRPSLLGRLVRGMLLLLFIGAVFLAMGSLLAEGLNTSPKPTPTPTRHHAPVHRPTPKR